MLENVKWGMRARENSMKTLRVIRNKKNDTEVFLTKNSMNIWRTTNELPKNDF